MRRPLSIAMGLSLGVLLTLFVVTPMEGRGSGQTTPPKEDRVEGNVHMIDKATKTITVLPKAKTNQVQVVYNDDTKFTFRNKSATLDDVKEGRRVICVGTTNDKHQLIARRIEVRDET
jgi:Domain of unknown function (DUF5666)